MSPSFAGSISPFARKYLSYVGWTPERHVDPGAVEAELKRWHWQGNLPDVWFEICASIDRLPLFSTAHGLPERTSEDVKQDGFRAYDLAFMASDASNNAYLSEDLREAFGCDFGPLGLFGGWPIWLVDTQGRFYVWQEGNVTLYGTGLRDGFDSLLKGQAVDHRIIPYNPDAWDARFPEPLPEK
ncbi:SUKH-3 domain-containing protein [Deinococcus oregonensis]|uniref:SUKH-3 domain-containing protein n=1 Tax=Deinococcus oregonensis TaxID=1805970 RepID=A0ABV6B1X9_9DEIO|nr:SUKH-3 domain-containing protein [Deinococcus sp. Arct2-2]THF67998.1 hypothetical protein E7T06_18330 [Deinococcus sp. Arct2-2]